MGQGRNPFRHTGWLRPQHELARGVASAVLLVVLRLAGLPLLFVLLLPAMTYAGLWLLLGSPAAALPRPIPATPTVRGAYDECLRLHTHIMSLCGAIADLKTRDLVQRISTRIDQILEVVTEDDHPEVCLKLLEPLTVTDNFLAHYVKLLRRGHEPAEMKERVRANLTTLERGFADIWQELIQEAVVDLGKLSDVIEETIEQLPVPVDVASLPPELPEGAGRSHPPHIAALISALTPRQVAILRILTTGRTDQEIADMLFISKRTVTTHLTEIYDKIQVRNRAEAVAFAVRWGLAPADEPESTAARST
jgi:DNA-binding CsgD family transcriptional regulator